MKTKFTHHPLFATPESVQSIFDWIERLPATDRMIAYTPVMMLVNYLAAQQEESPTAPQPKPNN
jgi:hypothetical protein